MTRACPQVCTGGGTHWQRNTMTRACPRVCTGGATRLTEMSEVSTGSPLRPLPCTLKGHHDQGLSLSAQGGDTPTGISQPPPTDAPRPQAVPAPRHKHTSGSLSQQNRINTVQISIDITHAAAQAVQAAAAAHTATAAHTTNAAQLVLVLQHTRQQMLCQHRRLLQRTR